MQVSVCVGDYATTPYSMPGLEISVYCMEELCYGIRENAFLLDADLMDEELADWIEQECGLRELAAEVRNMLMGQTTLSAFVTFLMEAVMMYDAEVISEVSRAVRNGSGLSGIERRKKQIDYLVKKKKYPAAIHRYNELLCRWEESGEDGEVPAGKVLASILHNKGVALTGMMEYEEAAQCFLQAYEQDADKTYYEAYLAAKRIELDETDYIAFIAELPGSYDCSMRLEKTMEQLMKDYEEQERHRMLMEHRELRTDNRQRYYDESDHITRTLRISYRNSVSE
ncbi:MAG: hypothetical protein IJ833_09630 [Lachnospiraceae bacterium]|nr:hypothetical protein [Lachnospiraceae bacterium]